MRRRIPHRLGTGQPRLVLRAQQALRLGLGLACAMLLTVVGHAARAQTYLHIRLDGTVNPIEQRHVTAALERAAREGDLFVLLSLDTPGGVVSSMQHIVTAITNSQVPVIGFVEPRSAQATSAGALVLLATDVAAMAPGTRVGSAHPVGQGQPLPGVLDEKATNSLATLARSLANRRGRPATLAEEMVTSSRSFTAEEAQAQKLVELVAHDPAELLRQLDGRSIEFHGRPLVLRTRGLGERSLELSWIERALDALAEPTIASLLVSLGLAGIVYEFASPGIGLGGIVGGVCLLVGLLGLSVLPITIAGVLLLLAGFAAIAVEVKVPSHGLLAGAGVLTVLLGIVVLVDPSSYFGGGGRVQWQLLAPLLATATGGALLLGRLARRAQRAPSQTGAEALVGRLGTARTRFARQPGQTFEGTVWVDGTRWLAQSMQEIPEGAAIEVVRCLRQPLRLEVRLFNQGAA